MEVLEIQEQSWGACVCLTSVKATLIGNHTESVLTRPAAHLSQEGVGNRGAIVVL